MGKVAVVLPLFYQQDLYPVPAADLETPDAAANKTAGSVYFDHGVVSAKLNDMSSGQRVHHAAEFTGQVPSRDFPVVRVYDVFTADDADQAVRLRVHHGKRIDVVLAEKQHYPVERIPVPDRRKIELGDIVCHDDPFKILALCDETSNAVEGDGALVSAFGVRDVELRVGTLGQAGHEVVERGLGRDRFE